jgi:hypothetical protein
VRALLGRQDADAHEVAHPPRGALFSCHDELKETIVPQGFSVDRVRDQNRAVMHIRCDFADRVDHLVAIRSLGDDVEAEILAARLAGHAELRQQVRQAHA